MARNSGGRLLSKDSMVIVCEGTETEYPYFKELCSGNINIKVVPKASEIITKKAKLNRTTKRRNLVPCVNLQFTGPEYYVGLPEIDSVTYDKYKSEPTRWVRAAQLFQEREKYYEAWAVFDMDKGRNRALPQAFRMTTLTLQIAFSAYSIEEWFLMHFERNGKTFTHSECKDARGKVVNCGNIRCVSDQNCHGDQCLGGYLREKGFIPEYTKNKGKEYAQLTKDRLHVACVNAAWSRSLSSNLPYLCNPYSDVDKLVKRILGRNYDIKWVRQNESFNIDSNNFKIKTCGTTLKLIFEGPGAVALISANQIYWCNDDYENIVSACNGVNFNFNTNKKEVILSSNGFNTTNKILCVKSNSHEVYVDLG